ncbi:MAG: gamma-glutamyltransferase [Acidobacteriota bacterium]
MSPRAALKHLVGLALLLADGATAARAATPPAQAGAAPAPPKAVAIYPEVLRVEEVASPLGVVVTDSPAASAAGVRMLEQGGNAIDAAVAAAFTLGATEYGGSGIGGGTFMLVHLADGRTLAIDGACIVPVAVDPPALQRLRESDQLYGHACAAVPGSLAALDYALAAYGTKTLSEVLAPAIEAAEYGASMSPIGRDFIDYYLIRIWRNEYLAALLLKDGASLWEQEHRYCFLDLARTLRRLAARGAADFYRGGIAREIEKDMVKNGGPVRRADLARLRAAEKQPVRGSYRGLEVLAYPAPAAGVAVIEALQILERFPPELLRDDSVDRLHLLLEANRLAAADLALADRSSPMVGWQLQKKEHATRRAALIRFDRALTQAEISPPKSAPWEGEDTTQVSVADALGNAVSLTQTLSRAYGVAAAAPSLGFPYNSALEGFDYKNPEGPLYPRPFREAPVPLAPTMVLRDGRPLLMVGSAGSGRIPSSVVATIVNVVDRQMCLRDAIGAPRALWSGVISNKGYVEMAAPITLEQVDTLEKRGFWNLVRQFFPARPDEVAAGGDTNAVLVDFSTGLLIGAGDPRRQGVARGVSGRPSR